MKKIDIIWNVTSICMWDCGICCVDAKHVIAKNKTIIIRSENLSKVDKIPYLDKTKSGSMFEQAMNKRIGDGFELTLEEKLKVLDNITGYDVKIDFSGGDPFAVSHTKILMTRAAKLFGKHNVTVTATGAGLTRVKVEEIAPILGELNFTYDTEGCRPNGYAIGNLKQAEKFQRYGVKTRGETPLTIDNINDVTLSQIYMDLHHAKIPTHLIMRLFPSGRGMFLQHKTPTVSQYKQAIELLRSLENKYKYPKIKLQCALKFLDKRLVPIKNPCDLVTESFGLMPNGTLLGSPWAIGDCGQPISKDLVLGNLVTTRLEDILATEKVKMFTEHADDNFGHCKMQSFFSTDEGMEKMLFKKEDPLYKEWQLE